MFTAPLLSVAKGRNDPDVHQRMDGRGNKLWCTPNVEYYSVTKRGEVPPRAPTGMNLEDIMLCERASHKKTHLESAHLREMPRSSLETEDRLGVARE